MKITEFDKMLSSANRQRKEPGDLEHRIQSSCVRYFRYRHPDLAGLLFAVPNGGRRDKATGARLKEEGVVAGVADMILLKRNSRYGALLIEMKVPGGRQSDSQKAWQKIVSDEYKYVVCYSLDDFAEAINNYLKDV